MGILDYLFDTKDAHKAALADLVTTADQTPVAPSPDALKQFLIRRQQDYADPALPEQSPYGGMLFGGNKFGGNTFGGNRFGGNQFGASAPPPKPVDQAAIDAVPMLGDDPLTAKLKWLRDKFNEQPPLETPNEYYPQQTGAPVSAPWAAMTQDAPQSQTPLGPWQTSIEGGQAPVSPQAPAPQSAPPQSAAPAAVAATMRQVPAEGPFQSGLMGGLSAFSDSLAQGNGLLGSIGRAFGARSPLEEQGLNQTYRVLVAKGVDPEIAKAAVMNPSILQQVLPTAFPPKAPIEKLDPGQSLAYPLGFDENGKPKYADVTPQGGVATKAQLEFEARKPMALQLGLKPGTVEYNAYLANGKLPDVTPDHAAIREADSQVQASQHLIEDMQRALQLSGQAYAGPGAETRGYVSSILPGNHPGGEATSEYANVIQSSILPGLKTIFPGRVTNADLKLMQELQGSASYSQKVREDILRRGIDRAQQIVQEKTAAAKSLRDGTYYKPGGYDAGQVAPQVQQQAQAEAAPISRDAIEMEMRRRGLL